MNWMQLSQIGNFSKTVKSQLKEAITKMYAKSTAKVLAGFSGCDKRGALVTVFGNTRLTNDRRNDNFKLLGVGLRASPPSVNSTTGFSKAPSTCSFNAGSVLSCMASLWS